MARSRSHIPLNVFLNARRVGELRKEPSGAILFRYSREWLDWEATFPVSLSLPLREDKYIGAPVSHVFENLLPDNDAIRMRVAERVGAEGIDAYSMLLALGHDCIGALQFLPDGDDPGPAGQSNGVSINRAGIAALIDNLASAPLGLGPDEDFRISLAGAQEKTALLRKNGKWFKPSGTSATTHILKPQVGRLPNGVDLSTSVENEYLCLKLLAAFGVPTAKAEMVDCGGRRTLVVERFDRIWTRDRRLIRLPQEDCCQALSVPPTRKYQSDGGPGIANILDLLQGSDDPAYDTALFLRAVIVFWLLGATDGHAKNFSIFIMPGGGYRLTPLYDVLTTQPNLDAKLMTRRQFKLAMSAGDSGHYGVADLLPRHFMQTAKKSRMGEAQIQRVFADLAANVVRWMDDVIAALPGGFPDELVTSVKGGVTSRLRLVDAYAHSPR